jgi:hypothetical protein
MPSLTSTTLGRFCRELASGLDDTPTLLTEWGVSAEDFERIRTSPAFAAEMKVVMQEMQDLGADAGYIYRMKSLSEEMLPEFVRMLKDPVTPTSTRFDMIKWAAEMARLKEKPSKTDPQAGPRGPSVTFHFGAGLPIQTTVTVQAEPDAPADTYGQRPQQVIDIQPSPRPMPSTFEGFEV